jgi:Protein of unknown function (DUF2796)
MKLKHTALTSAVLLALIGSAAAHDHEKERTQRQLGSHVHGVGELNIALEGKTLSIELSSPAANIVGFEQAPETDQERTALANAETKLKNIATLFVFDQAAKCVVGKADVTRSSHAHEEHDDHAHEEHAHHDDHAHDGGEASGEHADINLAATVECAKPAALRTITVNLFDVFPLTETLRAAFIGDNGQSAAELTKTARVLTLPK